MTAFKFRIAPGLFALALFLLGVIGGARAHGPAAEPEDPSAYVDRLVAAGLRGVDLGRAVHTAREHADWVEVPSVDAKDLARSGEPLGDFVNRKIGEGLKGLDLAIAILNEIDRRRDGGEKVDLGKGETPLPFCDPPAPGAKDGKPDHPGDGSGKEDGDEDGDDDVVFVPPPPSGKGNMGKEKDVEGDKADPDPDPDPSAGPDPKPGNAGGSKKTGVIHLPGNKPWWKDGGGSGKKKGGGGSGGGKGGGGKDGEGKGGGGQPPICHDDHPNNAKAKNPDGAGKSAPSKQGGEK